MRHLSGQCVRAVVASNTPRRQTEAQRSGLLKGAGEGRALATIIAVQSGATNGFFLVRL